METLIKRVFYLFFHLSILVHGVELEDLLHRERQFGTPSGTSRFSWGSVASKIVKLALWISSRQESIIFYLEPKEARFALLPSWWFCILSMVSSGWMSALDHPSLSAPPTAPGPGAPPLLRSMLLLFTLRCLYRWSLWTKRGFLRRKVRLYSYLWISSLSSDSETSSSSSSSSSPSSFWVGSCSTFLVDVAILFIITLLRKPKN